MSGKRVTVDVIRNDDGHIKTQYSCITNYTFKYEHCNSGLIVIECMKQNLNQKLEHICISGVMLAYAELMRGLNISLNLIKL